MALESIMKESFFLTAEYNTSKAWVVEFQDNLEKEWLVFSGTDEPVCRAGIENRRVNIAGRRGWEELRE